MLPAILRERDEQRVAALAADLSQLDPALAPTGGGRRWSDLGGGASPGPPGGPQSAGAGAESGGGRRTSASLDLPEAPVSAVGRGHTPGRSGGLAGVPVAHRIETPHYAQRRQTAHVNDCTVA